MGWPVSEIPHSTIAHSRLGASSMYRWKACPKSVQMCKNLPPEEPNPWAEEGSKAHDLAEQVLVFGADIEDIRSAEMREAVKLYCNTVLDDYLCRQTNPKDGKPDRFEDLWIEKQLDLSKIYPGCFGTADAIIWDRKPRILYVLDFKYGTDPVDPVENLQMLYYALGAMHTLNLNPTEVELAIIQPRVKRKRKISRWRTDIIRLMDFESELVEAAKRTEDPNAPLVAGRHCYWCRAKKTCPALLRMNVQAAETAFKEFDQTTIDDLL
jgi:Protein of unknown function (DUF2800)